jgi:hypothetical protein
MPVAVPDGALMTFSSHNLERVRARRAPPPPPPPPPPASARPLPRPPPRRRRRRLAPPPAIAAAASRPPPVVRRRPQEWRAAFDASLLPADASWTLFMIAFRLATLARFHDVGAHSLWLAADAAAGGALLWLQRRRPATYLARRGALVAAVRWARAVHG